jgi:hypothetical protein
MLLLLICPVLRLPKNQNRSFFPPTGLAREMFSIPEVNGWVPDISSIRSTSVTVAFDNKKKEA